MAELQNFRSAFNGFNREDVVRYIEYLNNRHNAEHSQFQSQMQTMEEELNMLRSAPQADPEAESRLEEAQARCEALEAELAAVKEQLAQVIEEMNKPQTDEELAAYRRAERAERIANERVTQLYAQANGALADATVKVDAAAQQVAQIADQVVAQLGDLHTAVSGGRNTLRDAAAALYAVRPIAPEE